MGGVSVEWIRSLRFIAGMATSADGSSSSISSSSSRSSSSNVGSGSGSAGVRKSGDGEDGAVVLSAKEKLWKREQALLSVSEITPSLNIQAAAASGSADVGIEIAKLDMFSGGMQASLTPGDIVMELNEQPVNSLSDVHTLLVSLSLQAGDVVDLMVVRALDGREEYVACELGDLHGKLSLSGIRQLRTEGGLHVHTGTLYDQQSAFDVLSKVPATLNVKTRSTSVQGGTVSALEITGMRAGASQQQAALQALSRAGVNVGDYILSIDGVPCADSTALGRLLNSKTAGDSVSVVRQRGRSGDADSVLVELEGDMTVGSVKNSNSNVKNLPQSSSEWVRCLRVMAGLATHDSSDGARAMQARGTNPKTRNVSTELVKQAQQELTLMQPSLGMTLAQSDTPTLGAVKVAAVDASGMALQAFIVPGDHLLSINGEVITDPFAYHRLLDACKVGETLSVDVRRALDARVETLTVEVGSSPSSASSASFLTAKETQSKIRDLRAIAGMGVQSRTVLSPSEALSSLRALTAVHGMSLQAAKSNAKSGYAGLSVIGVDGGEGVSSVSIAGRAGLVEGDVLTSVIINSDVNDSARSHTVEQHDLTAADTSALLRSVIEESRLAGDTVTFSVHRANTDAEFKVDLELAGLNKARAHAANAGQARAQRVVPQEKVRALRLLAGLPICLYVGEKLDDIRHRNTRASQGERRQKEQRGKLLSELRSIMPSLGLEVMDAPDGKEGVVVTSVSATGSAVHASIIVGDTVRALNKTRVPNTTSFKRAVNSMTAGEVVTVTLLRALDGRADSEACEVGGDGVSLSSIRSLRSQLDMSVHAGKTYTKDSAAAELREFQPRLGFKIVDGVGAGVKVIDVMPQGPAARAGLQDGDFILKMAGDASDETSDMKHILARLTVGDRVPLLVKRADGNTFDSAIELGARGERTDTVEFVRSLRRIAGMEVMQ